MSQVSPTAEQKALEVFRQSITNAGLYFQSTDGTASHDEPTLLRFLRARSLDPNGAFKQFSATEAWRKKFDVDRLFATFDPDEFYNARRYYPRWTGRTDKKGVPVYVYHIASLDKDRQKELSAVSDERKYQRVVVLVESLMRLVLPTCSALPHPGNGPVSSCTTIVDLGGVSLGTLWSLRNILKASSELATANYPETLSYIAVVNSPSFFPTVWGWIKNWFDEGTRNKIEVLSDNGASALLKSIDSANLPTQYGGELSWTFQDDPNLDENSKAILGSWPRGPAILVDGKVQQPSVPSGQAGPPSDATSAKGA